MITLGTWAASLLLVAIGGLLLLIRPPMPRPGSKLEKYWVETSIIRGIEAEDLRRMTVFVYRFAGLIFIASGVALPWIVH